MKRNKKPLLVLVLLFSVAGALLVSPSTVEAQRRPFRALLTPRPAAVGDGATDDYDALQNTINRGLGLLFRDTGDDHTNDGVIDSSDINWDVMEVTIDLEGLTYRFNTGLEISLEYPVHNTSLKTRLRIINGTLLSSVGQHTEDFNGDGNPDTTFTRTTAIRIFPAAPASGASSFEEYPEVTFENVRLQKMQYARVTGIQIERGLRCSFLNCAIEERNIDDGSTGFERGLVLQGCQMCTFIDCHFGKNENHVVFEELESTVDGVVTYTPNTDCRFYACTFSESTGVETTAWDGTDWGSALGDFSGVAIVSTGSNSTSQNVTAAQCLFDACSIETARDSSGNAVSLVSLKDTRNMKFRACRFENGNGSNTAPLVLLGTGDGEESSDARFIDCNFSGDEYQDGYCIEGGSDVTGTALIANVFPSNDTYTSVSLSEGYSAVANTNLGDQELVNTEDLDSDEYTINGTVKVHHLTMIDDSTFDVNLVDGTSVTVLLEGSYDPTWTDVLWSEGDEPAYSSPSLYTFTQIGGSIYGVSGGTGFAVAVP